MKNNSRKRYLVLGILFFLPVLFLLMLYPAKHNYVPLDVVNEGVIDLNGFSSDTDDKIMLKDHITIVGFLGSDPLSNAIGASNLKELIYDKFKGFKKFQIVIVQPIGTEAAIESLKKEINTYEDLKFWHYVYGSPEQIEQLYKSLDASVFLDSDFSTHNVFIVDKDLNQRGRIDARDKKELEANKPAYRLMDYDCIKVSVIKNKMSEDLRILFTEYRQKRKGQFDSTTRRASDLKKDNG
ncbi:hypothetical protein [Winogradskyella aurantiaca]|uniref:hypothetical protein n=1 Tax=Winogradskyella aurantiaca TaxID=2219558 RepID=UPI000E1D30E8|nr:hypothetical protein [Winogradskyella aurantiaca]